MMIGGWFRAKVMRTSASAATALYFCMPAAVHASEDLLEQSLTLCHSSEEKQASAHVQRFVDLGWQPLTEAELNWAVPLNQQAHIAWDIGGGSSYDRDLAQYLTDEWTAGERSLLLQTEDTDGNSPNTQYLFHPQLPQVVMNTNVDFYERRQVIRVFCSFKGPDNETMRALSIRFDELAQSAGSESIERNNFHWDDGVDFLHISLNSDPSLAFATNSPHGEIVDRQTSLYDIVDPSSFGAETEPKLKYIFRTYIRVNQEKANQ